MTVPLAYFVILRIASLLRNSRDPTVIRHTFVFLRKSVWLMTVRFSRSGLDMQACPSGTFRNLYHSICILIHKAFEERQEQDLDVQFQ